MTQKLHKRFSRSGDILIVFYYFAHFFFFRYFSPDTFSFTMTTTTTNMNERTNEWTNKWMNEPRHNQNIHKQTFNIVFSTTKCHNVIKNAIQIIFWRCYKVDNTWNICFILCYKKFVLIKPDNLFHIIHTPFLFTFLLKRICVENRNEKILKITFYFLFLLSWD